LGNAPPRPTMSSPELLSNTSKRRKIGSRACDGCKVRKVRCTEAPPCDRCVAVGIACTFNKVQAARGPRSLRAKTIQQIQATQARAHEIDGGGDGSRIDYQARNTGPVHGYSGMTTWAGTGVPRYQEQSQQQHRQETQQEAQQQQEQQQQQGTPIAALVLRLCVYRLRLYPVWPIVAVEEVIASLQRDGEDLETYALANAVGAATMAQLKLDGPKSSADADIHDKVTAAMMEAESQRARVALELRQGHGAAASLTMLRVSFFLHIYHENQAPGGVKSLLYLREAITLAQIMGLHRAAAYAYLPPSDQRMRRRILWLLFVTERGVAMLHKLPVVIMSSTALPSLDGCDGEDEAHILPAFKKLVNLFWIFDQSGAFDIIQNSTDEDASGTPMAQNPGTSTQAAGSNLLEALQRTLQEVPVDVDLDGSNDVQRADICVTRQWMQVLLWRATLHRKKYAPSESQSALSRPIQIAKEFLDLTSRLPDSALEAHGPTIEFKIYDIASAVTDAIAGRLRESSQTQSYQVMDLRPTDILLRLQQMLASCRGGNKNLLASLSARIAQVGAEPTGPGRFLRSYEPSRPLSSSSQWFSLVAAAELEQFSAQAVEEGESQLGHHQSQSHGTAISSPEFPLGLSSPSSLSWQPLEILGQLRQLDSWPAGVDDLSPDVVLELLANGQENSPWFPGASLAGSRAR
jgi:hypothetical protein